MFTVTVHFNSEKKLLQYQEPVLLSSALHDAEIEFSMPCSGNHTCGKCKVTASGLLSEMTDQERSKLTKQEIDAGIRLACFAMLEGDTTISISNAKQENILSAGIMEEFVLCPATDGYGVAVDIGTTTVVSYLYHTTSLKPLQIVSHHNSQSRFGADVISRIEYCNKNGVAAPKEAIVSQLNSSFAELCRLQGISTAELCTVVITGNTTMLHLLCGLDPRGIATAPFTPQSLFGTSYLPSALGLNLEKNCSIYLPRSISSYVGADITCALLSSGMTEKKEVGFLIDIGTNGEMALFANNQLKCCSTAAGPAFEGAGIRMGMSALDGAINKVWEKDGKLCYTTIGDKKPTGICGSGIIDAVAAFVRCGLIDETGLIDKENEKYAACIGGDDETAILIGDSGVIITQTDIRKIQLAKSAICAGIDTLLYECSITAEQIDVFYLAGGFGSFIDKRSAADMGLIPNTVVSHVRVIGNAAGNGASMCLLSTTQQKKSENIADMADEVELSGNPYFMDRYIDRMMFEQIDTYK